MMPPSDATTDAERRSRGQTRLKPKGNACWVCGPENASGLHVQFAPESNNGSRAPYIARAEHGGWPGILHGGVAFALMDEALGWSLYFHGSAGVTARFEARLRGQIPIGSELVIRAWTIQRRQRLVKARAEVRLASDDGPLLGEADATMYLLDADVALTSVGDDSSKRDEKRVTASGRSTEAG